VDISDSSSELVADSASKQVLSVGTSSSEAAVLYSEVWELEQLDSESSDSESCTELTASAAAAAAAAAAAVDAAAAAACSAVGDAASSKASPSLPVEMTFSDSPGAISTLAPWRFVSSNATTPGCASAPTDAFSEVSSLEQSCWKVKRSLMPLTCVENAPA
jgi:hypothetical protein